MSQFLWNAGLAVLFAGWMIRSIALGHPTWALVLWLLAVMIQSAAAGMRWLNR